MTAKTFLAPAIFAAMVIGCQVPHRCQHFSDESLIDVDDAVEEAMTKMKRRKRMDDEEVERVLSRAVKKSCERTFGRKPLVDVSVLRV